MKKRLLSAVLAGSMMLTMLPSTAFAAEGDVPAVMETAETGEINSETDALIQKAITEFKNQF